MPFKNTNTKVAIQPENPVSSQQGKNLKFPKGGTSAGSNGISNNALTVPQAEFPNPKQAFIYVGKDSTTVKVGSAYRKFNAATESQVDINKTFAVDSSQPEILSIHSLGKEELDSMLAACYQAYVEDKCSLEFGRTILKNSFQANQKEFDAIKSSLKEELNQSEKILNAVEAMLGTCLNVDEILQNRSTKSIHEFALEKYNVLQPDKLGLQNSSLSELNPVSIFSKVTAGSNIVEEKSNTAIMTQLLSLTAKCFKNGSTSMILKMGPDDSIELFDAKAPESVQMHVSQQDYIEKYNQLTLKKLSIGANDPTNYVYGTPQSSPYYKRFDLGMIKSVDSIRKSAYLMCLLSNEFALSTGLGRLEGTSIGQSFNSSGDYVQHFLGTNGITDASSEASYPGSLVDYFIINEDGTSRINSKKGVVLFDGTNFKSTKDRINVIDAFVIGTAREPLNKDKNKVSEFSAAVSSATNRFDLGIEFLKSLQCRDKKLKLLTPRGLFSRLIKDLSSSMLDISSVEKSGSQTAIDISILSMLGNKGGILDSQKALKDQILALLIRKAFILLYKIDSSDSKVTASESSKPGEKSTTTKVSIQDGSSSKTITVTSSQSSNTGDASSENAVKANPKIARFCLNEQELYAIRNTVSTPVDKLLLKAFKHLQDVSSQAAYESISASAQVFNISIGQIFDDMLKSQDGILDKLAKIYIDLCEESLKFCSEENGEASPVTSNRLTRNSRLDSAICLSMILEAACSILGEFVQSGFDKESSFYKDASGLDFDRLKREEQEKLSNAKSNIFVIVGDKTPATIASRALGAISDSSFADNFQTLFVMQNQQEILPSIGGIKKTDNLSASSIITAQTIVDLFYDLNLEREFPAICISSIAGMISYVKVASSKYVDLAKQMLGLSKQADQIKSLISFCQSPVGSKYISSLNSFSVENSRRKLKSLKSSLSSEYGRNPKLTLSEMRCLEVLLPTAFKMSDEFKFMVIALPKDYVFKNLGGDYSVKNDKANSSLDSVLKISVTKNPMFSYASQVSEQTTMLRSPYSPDSFTSFINLTPENVAKIVSESLVDGKISGTKFVNQKKRKDEVQAILTKEVYSYFVKKAFSILSSTDLFAENITEDEGMIVSSNAASIAKILASSYGLSSSTFDSIFVTSGNKTLVDKGKLLSLVFSNFNITKNEILVSNPVLSFEEAEMFYDLFSTVHFQSGNVSNTIFSASVLDETVGIIINDSEFTESEVFVNDVVGINGNFEYSSKENSLLKALSSNLIPSFDTYSINVNFDRIE